MDIGAINNAQRIESDDLSLTKLFSDFYVVPAYQREYVWTEAQVEQLLVDINNEFGVEAESLSEYFIGSIVVTPNSDGTLELIDGQQRVTTLFVLLCALRDRLTELEPSRPLDALSRLIAATDVDDRGRDVYRYRVELQYEDSSGVLKDLAERKPPSETPSTRSVSNVLAAHAFMGSFLASEFGSDVDALRRFHAYLVRHVKVIRVSTGSVAHALKVFETINDRGVGLDSMDLLKNLMFMQASPAVFEALKSHWKVLVDTLHGTEKPLRFLRYYIFATFDVDRLREDQIYSWFVRNGDLCGYRADPVGFVEQLVHAARAYAYFAEGRDTAGKPNRYLMNLRELSGAARQQFILLLAGRHLRPIDFTELCRNLENLFFAYIITREPTKEFERRFTSWAPTLRGVENEVQLNSFFEATFRVAQRGLAPRFDLAFMELRQQSLQKYRVKYVLAKLSQYVDEQAWGTEGGDSDLASYLRPDIEVEHVLPQVPSVVMRGEFDQLDFYVDYVGRLGNLALLEKSINASVGNGAFADKQVAYRQSRILLTKSLGETIQVGRDTAIDRAVRALESFDAWTSTDIERRQMMLRDIAVRVWDMPMGT